MRNENESEADKTLSRTLRRWEVRPPLPPRFSEQVWARIERAQVPVDARSRLARWLGAMLPRSRVALSYCVALLVLGGVAGSLAAQVSNSRLDATLRSRYIQSVDQFRMERPNP
jgi:hypothetical protein